MLTICQNCENVKHLGGKCVVYKVAASLFRKTGKLVVACQSQKMCRMSLWQWPFSFCYFCVPMLISWTRIIMLEMYVSRYAILCAKLSFTTRSNICICTHMRVKDVCIYKCMTRSMPKSSVLLGAANALRLKSQEQLWMTMGWGNVLPPSPKGFLAASQSHTQWWYTCSLRLHIVATASRKHGWRFIITCAKGPWKTYFLSGGRFMQVT